MEKFTQFMNRRNTGTPPDIIHFKHVYTKNIGVIPSPIHFKHVNEDVDNSNLPPFSEWRESDDNSHLPVDMSDFGPAPGFNFPAEFVKKHYNVNEFRDNRLKDILSPFDDMDTDPIAQKAITAYTTHNTADKGKTAQPKDYYSYQLNQALLKGTPIKRSFFPSSTQKALQSTVDGLDYTINKYPIGHKLNVYSGLSFDPRDHFDENGRMQSPAFISATHSKRIATDFATKRAGGDSPINIMHFHLEPGDPATHISQYSGFPGEKETLIGRNTTLRHMGTQSYSDPNGRTINIHHVAIDRNK